MASEQVLLRCSRESGKLRVRILSRGYFHDANCQFPRNIRSEGQLYAVAPRSVRLVQTASGRNFYRISQPIKLLDSSSSASDSDDNDDNGDSDNNSSNNTASATLTGKRATKTASGRKRRKRPAEKPRAVFDHKDEPDCVVCLDAAKEQIFVPCGHFCMCKDCIAQLCQPKKCPLCREAIKSTILPSEL